MSELVKLGCREEVDEREIQHTYFPFFSIPFKAMRLLFIVNVREANSKLLEFNTEAKMSTSLALGSL